MIETTSEREILCFCRFFFHFDGGVVQPSFEKREENQNKKANPKRKHDCRKKKETVEYPSGPTIEEAAREKGGDDEEREEAERGGRGQGAEEGRFLSSFVGLAEALFFLSPYATTKRLHLFSAFLFFFLFLAPSKNYGLSLAPRRTRRRSRYVER